MECKHHGYYGWAAIAAFVAAFDLVAHKVGGQTLSNAFWEIRRSPVKHAVISAVWAGITVHLFKRDVWT